MSHVPVCVCICAADVANRGHSKRVFPETKLILSLEIISIKIQLNLGLWYLPEHKQNCNFYLIFWTNEGGGAAARLQAFRQAKRGKRHVFGRVLAGDRIRDDDKSYSKAKLTTKVAGIFRNLHDWFINATATRIAVIKHVVRPSPASPVSHLSISLRN